MTCDYRLLQQLAMARMERHMALTACGAFEHQRDGLRLRRVRAAVLELDEHIAKLEQQVGPTQERKHGHTTTQQERLT